MQSVEDLGVLNLKIYQDDELYRFTSDSVLLTRFATVKKGDVVADFCSGSGIVGLHLYGLYPDIKSVTLFEMQTPLADLSKKSVELNGLEEKFFVVNSKVQDIGSEYNGKFSLIVCNPPYMEQHRGFNEQTGHIAECKTELTLSLKELLSSVKKALKFGGRFAMVNRADRLTDVICEMRNVGIEPKRLQFFCGGSKPPYLFAVEGVNGGKSGIKILKEKEN
ncbi:MAG: methyltransferase [Clostridia bacterium]|nr:methyltransferase [Clostridia bacterium]